MGNTARRSDVSFACAFCALLCCVVLVRALHGAGVPLPSVLGADQDRSPLEARTYQQRPHPSASSLLDGSFQKQADAWVADRVPLRDSVLLANAALQRSGIALAAAMMGYDTYPTYYGSKAVVCGASASLANIPPKATEALSRAYEERASQLNSLVARHPGQRFYLYDVPRTESLDQSAAARLMSRPATHSFFREHVLESLVGVKVVDSTVSERDFAEQWSRTDHHWNVLGAREAYGRIADAMGFPADIPGIEESFEYSDPAFFGSLARTGRCLDFCDHVMDFHWGAPFEPDSLEVEINGARAEPEDLVHLRKYQEGAWAGTRLANRYAEYFHTDYAEIRITSGMARTERTLLLVADSYSNCMERFFAVQYATVLVYDARHNAETLDAYLTANPDVDDVLFLMSQNNITSDELGEKIG